ncbi:MAG: hypothetical protein NZ988_03945 [Thaumarchaeota archaeon]|nr:hypothetical protein [Candidatus Calditenuaceae archaeon]MDW8187182.1 hypothetical protein [Nitrososphaerota archaeon]
MDYGSVAVSRVEAGLERSYCEVCGNVARFCRLMRCPFYRHVVDELRDLISSSRSSVFGPTPPAMLVGERGYPRVIAGPAVSVAPEPLVGPDPREWLGRSLEELLASRLSLVMGRKWVDARRPLSERTVQELVEAELSIRPVDIELSYEGSIVHRPGFFARSMPHGPSVSLKSARVVGNPRIPRKVEEVIEGEMRAEQAAIELAESGLDQQYVTRALSIGALGSPARRRLVPTEWSITAVDDILSRPLLRRVRRYQTLNEVRLHSFSALHNSAHVLLLPTAWAFELLEGWLKFPEDSPYADHELHFGRTDYAENTGGAYYAVRLAVLQHLESERRQAGAVVFFEVGRGWIPLGVWRFREVTAAALESPPERFQTLEEALERIRPRLELPLERYLARSAVIRMLVAQGTLTGSRTL